MNPARSKRCLPKTTNARLTPRDWKAILFIGQAQPVATRHITTLWGASRAVVNRRARAWRDLGMVAVHTPEGMEGENRFTLTARGKAALVNRHGSEAADLRVPRAIGLVQLAHHELGATVHAALAVGGDDDALVMEQFLHEPTIRKRMRVSAGTQVVRAHAS